MDAPTPLNINNDDNNRKDYKLKITENLSYNNQKYNLKILKSVDNQNLIMKIESNDIENSDYYYQINYKLQDLYSLNKFFRQFDTIDEVLNAIENNKKLINEKEKNLKVYNISIENSKFYLNINLYLMSGEIQLLKIQLNKTKLTDKELIIKLKEYIKYIKGIPGVNELIESYKNRGKEIFYPKSNIIQKIEDFNFIYQELCKKLYKNKLKFIQIFNVLKDGDSATKFHEKCDNIGPNLSIIKTKENIIFGGFTMNNWSENSFFTKKDDLAFVFKLQNKKIYNIKKGENSIYCNKGNLINFHNAKGGYSTLYVINNCLSKRSNTCCKNDSSYQNFTIDYELNNGNQFFIVSEMEIYEIN